jgi:dynein heavy chain 1
MDTILKLLDSDEKLKKIDKKEHERRKDTIYNSIFEKVFLRVANSLLSKDLIIFCLKLVSIKLKNEEKALFDALIRPTTILITKLSKGFLDGIVNEDQLKQIEELTDHPLFYNLVEVIESDERPWFEFLSSANPEDKIPKIKSEATPFGKKLIDLILIKIFRPDKFNPIAYQLVKTVLGD